MRRKRLLLVNMLLRNASVVIFLGIFIILSLQSPKFLTLDNIVNILIQSSSIAIVAIGMTFVLLTAGIDLSVGAVMFLGAAVTGKMVLGALDIPISLALLTMLAIGMAWGLIIGVLVTRYRLAPFVVTLAALFIGRGLALLITENRAMNLPDEFREIATGKLLGIPFPVLIMFMVTIAGHLTLARTPFGRQIYATGDDPVRATKAGIPVSRVLCLVYVICGFCAALGGIVSLAQLSAVSPTFGEKREFDAIAAAVLGGTSLFGGRGSIFPGTVLGAILIQMIYNGLNILNADPYSYPLITAATIFIAVMIDSLRQRQLERLSRRKIRVED